MHTHSGVIMQVFNISITDFEDFSLIHYEFAFWGCFEDDCIYLQILKDDISEGQEHFSISLESFDRTGRIIDVSLATAEIIIQDIGILLLRPMHG